MDPDHKAMIEELKERHPEWGIDITPPPKGPSSGAVRQAKGSGLVRYVFGENERGRYLEYYSFHRIWGDSHRRIYGTCEVESLDTLETMRVVDPDPAIDKQNVERQNARNRRLLEELDANGLLSGGPVPGSFVINSALVTGVLDEGEGEGDPAEG